MLVNKSACFVNAANIYKCIERNSIEKEFLYRENRLSNKTNFVSHCNGFWYVMHCPLDTVSGFW